MSLIKAIKAQLGLSVTPANNFTLDASANNGTMKLARGNAGATTQDVMRVAADGKVIFPQVNIGGSSDQLMGGNIIKMGRSTLTFDGTGTAVLSFGSAFPTSISALTLTCSDITTGGEGVILSAFSGTLSGTSVRAIKNGAVFVGQAQVSFIAIGF
jgi:hypothetical protein